MTYCTCARANGQPHQPPTPRLGHQSSQTSFPTVILPERVDPLKRQHDAAEEDPYVLITRYSCAYFFPLYLTVVTATAIELLVKRVFYRTLARVRKMGSGGVSPGTSITHRSPATRLPLEVVEMIIAYLRYDKHSLRACTQICRSWYIAAVPHLHHTLIVANSHWGGGKFQWPNPIRYMHMLGLLPLVKEFQVDGRHDEFSPGRFNCCILRQFSALTNVQKLEIDCLDIPSFMPRIQRYFRHFLPTVRSLVLKKPEGTRRQIMYFIGLFQNLQDLGLNYSSLAYQEKPVGDLALIPAFVPPLRGQLKLESFNTADFLKDMIDLFGGIQFRFMVLYEVRGMRPLLAACAKTLESVVLDPADRLGEQLSLKGMQALANNFAAKSSLRDFDLSRNKALRTLQVPWSSINHASSDCSQNALRFLKHVLSTIKSPVFSMIVVFCGDDHFHRIEPWLSDRPLIRELSRAERAEEVSRQRRIFKIFREAHKVRNFRLELCASISGSAGEEPVRILEEVIAEERAKNGFKDFLQDPFVEYYPHR